MKRFLVLIIMLAISSSVFSQDMSWLVKKMKAADTVLLISHQATSGVVIMHSNRTTSSPPELIIGNKLNDTIVLERRIIRSTELDVLIQILTQPLQSKNINQANCFIPHHAIILIKDGNISYIDLCFSCQRYVWSNDLQSLGSFDNYKWNALKNFFLKQGFKYELGVK